MTLIAIGINHTTASVDLREQLAFAPEQMPYALADAQRWGIGELVIVSTCNRTDMFAAVECLDDWRKILEWWSCFHRVPLEVLDKSCYHLINAEAVRHLAKVASGMDSMVLGEPQILGQVKSAFAVAQQANTVGVRLGRLFPYIFTLAKQVRTKTAIGRNPVSVAFSAVSLAKRIFSDLASIKVLLIGAGETIELVIKHLREQGVSNLVVANRTLKRADVLAQNYGAKSALLGEIPDYLPAVDMVISSTASQLPIVGKGVVEQTIKQRKHRPMLMIDLAVPRDIEPQVAEISDVYLYTVDDLRGIVDENRRTRELEAEQAQEIINEGVIAYEKMQRELGAVDTLVQFRDKCQQIREDEVEKAMRQLKKGDIPEHVLLTLAHNITQKITHTPSIQIKKASAEGQEEALLWFQKLFEIHSESSSDDQDSD